MGIRMLGDLLGDKAAQGGIGGVVIGVVTNNQDPDELGRVKLRFPWLSEDYESNWARVASLMAGKERGAYFLPDVDDEVLVAFYSRGHHWSRDSEITLRAYNVEQLYGG